MEIEKIILDTVDSTMDYARENISSFDKKKLTVISAKEQTKGRGRFQRSWASPKGENLYVTLYFHLEKAPNSISSFAQFMTLCIARVLLKEGITLSLRWPNDILVNDKKIAGVLCETTRKNDALDIFLGFGLNVDTPLEILKKIEKPATSLKQETIHKWEKDLLLQKIEKQFLKDLPIFLNQGFSAFVYQFNQHLAYKGKQVVCSNGKNRWIGICHSLNSEGKLNLHLPNGEIETLSAADISLKKEG